MCRGNAGADGEGADGVPIGVGAKGGGAFELVGLARASRPCDGEVRAENGDVGNAENGLASVGSVPDRNSCRFVKPSPSGSSPAIEPSALWPVG